MKWILQMYDLKHAEEKGVCTREMRCSVDFLPILRLAALKATAAPAIALNQQL